MKLFSSFMLLYSSLIEAFSFTFASLFEIPFPFKAYVLNGSFCFFLDAYFLLQARNIFCFYLTGHFLVLATELL